MARGAALNTKVVVLDSSVVIKWFRQEEVLADMALLWRERFLNGSALVVVPDLMAYEIANALAYKQDLSTEQVQGAARSLFDMELEWAGPSAALSERAIELARTYGISVYDGVFVALAESLSARLITADRRLVDRLSTLKFVSFLGHQTGETLTTA
jgi:predicted nucleic acid-binding protein